jgi:hypothetical protein
VRRRKFHFDMINVIAHYFALRFEPVPMANSSIGIAGSVRASVAAPIASQDGSVAVW